MKPPTPAGWLRDARRRLARLPSLRMTRLPDAPAQPVRDPWPGDPGRGAALLKGELELGGATMPLRPGMFAERSGADLSGAPMLWALAHGFTWLRDLRALGTDAARLRARALVAEWIADTPVDGLPQRPDVAGARIAAWLGHYDFFAASADDAFRQKLMGRLVADARSLAASLPPEELDARALTALKGLIAAAVALPDHAAFLTRALRVLPQEITRQILPDGCHCERSPAQHLAALQDLTEIRALLQAAQAQPPASLAGAIERMAPALRALRHGDGGLALFNGTKEESAALIDQVLAQAGRAGRAPSSLMDGGFQRLQAGRSVLIMDCGAPAAAKIDRFAHAGTLSFELSIGRDRMIVNCGAAPAATGGWRDACRATAAHSTLVIADTNSSELRPDGLGRRPEKVEVQRQEANGAHWLDASHDGYHRPFGAIHRRRLYMSESGEDIRGEDALEAQSPQPYAVRFHLHPTVDASVQQDGEAVLLRLPSGSGWRLRADGARIGLEESIYLGGPEARRSEQVVLTGYQDGPQQVKWAITKVG
ncbi:heparinase II/III family protein [Limobrevibacterium gyesilva]|uniref:Heparinase II/III family protein n=1 Tax=Limobrevibacterium gyesilva TaxID=2991712 RepID=A0AA41YSM7_9PROT|nr:heparinase II/III family protein [Limobrevibacterium gyesilva]MCW3477817.1 heparinase II/III family protein [Limobrevibacterium gyesilva]